VAKTARLNAAMCVAGNSKAPISCSPGHGAATGSSETNLPKHHNPAVGTCFGAAVVHADVAGHPEIMKMRCFLPWRR
jgi:hypothetical protein